MANDVFLWKAQIVPIWSLTTSTIIPNTSKCFTISQICPNVSNYAKYVQMLQDMSKNVQKCSKTSKNVQIVQIIQKRPKMSKNVQICPKVIIYQNISKHDEIKQKNHFVRRKENNKVTFRTSRRSSWSKNDCALDQPNCK